MSSEQRANLLFTSDQRNSSSSLTNLHAFAGSPTATILATYTIESNAFISLLRNWEPSTWTIVVWPLVALLWRGDKVRWFSAGMLCPVEDGADAGDHQVQKQVHLPAGNCAQEETCCNKNTLQTMSCLVCPATADQPVGARHLHLLHAVIVFSTSYHACP